VVSSISVIDMTGDKTAKLLQSVSIWISIFSPIETGFDTTVIVASGELVTRLLWLGDSIA
jgi:hypothetical protein